MYVLQYFIIKGAQGHFPPLNFKMKVQSVMPGLVQLQVSGAKQ